MEKTLILTYDASGMPDWEARAISRQMADWLESNKTLFKNENLILLPATGSTRLFWLEGAATQEDIKTLDEVKDRITPVLEVALDLKLDKANKYSIPRKYKNVAKTLSNIRARQFGR